MKQLIPKYHFCAFSDHFFSAWVYSCSLHLASPFIFYLRCKSRHACCYETLQVHGSSKTTTIVKKWILFTFYNQGRWSCTLVENRENWSDGAMAVSKVSKVGGTKVRTQVSRWCRRHRLTLCLNAHALFDIVFFLRLLFLGFKSTCTTLAFKLCGLIMGEKFSMVNEKFLTR